MPFSVTYNGNGSDGGAVPVDPATHAAGATVPIQPGVNLTKTGAVFAYWNTKADGSGAFHGWPADTSFLMPAANVTLFAQWFVNTGLPAGGVTAHYTFAYDSSLRATGLEPGRTISLMEAAERDFGKMVGWFRGITPPSPIQIFVTRLTGGANNTGQIRLKPNTNDPNELRSLIISEVTESFMATQNKGWGFLPGINNEMSCGEGLSLFLTQQFELQEGIAGPNTAFTGSVWMNSSLPTNNPASTRFALNPDGSVQTDFGSRFDYVNSTLPFPGNGPGTGCSILFIYYLFHQLGFGIDQIIAAAPGYINGKLDAIAPLRGVFENLTGQLSPDPFPSFKRLVESYFPGTSVAVGNHDNPFPLKKLRSEPGGILWHNSSTNETQIWFWDGHRVIGRATVLGQDGNPAFVGPPFSIVGYGHFSPSGNPDIVWHNSSTGETQIWFMDRHKVIDRQTVLDEHNNPVFIGPPFSIVGTCGPTGDNESEIIWHNSSTGETQIWFMNRHKLKRRATVIGVDGGPFLVGPPWSIVGAGDFGENGVPDIVWHNSSTNETQIWFMGEVATNFTLADYNTITGRVTVVLGVGGNPFFVGTPWSIVGVGDSVSGDEREIL
jgi:hypothetical protein